MRRRTVRLAIMAATSALLLAALTGCEAAKPPRPSSSSPTAEPVFASEEEALAAAKEAYAAFLEMSDAILMDGGQRPERIKKFASADLARIEMEGYADAREKGYRSTGGSKYDNMMLQALDPDSRPGVVSVYLCSDVSTVDVIDSGGVSLVSPDRPARTPFQVTFDVAEVDPPRLVVGSSTVWDGPGIC